VNGEYNREEYYLGDYYEDYSKDHHDEEVSLVVKYSFAMKVEKVITRKNTPC
jgi:hypothetical protein